VIIDFEKSNLFSQGVSSSQKIFLINCLESIRQPLSDSGINNDYTSSLSTKIKGYITGLIEEEVIAILERCKLQNKVSIIRDRVRKYNKSEIVAKEDEIDEEKPLAHLDDMDSSSFSESLKLFFGLVIGSEGVVPEFQQIQDPQVRGEVGSGVAKALLQAYELVYTTLLDPGNGYVDSKSMLRHTPEQVKTILAI
jgi:hypothetical protein